MSFPVRPVGYSGRLFAPLLAEAADEGGIFLLRLRDEWESCALRFDAEGEILLGAFDGEQLVGVGGLSLDPYAPEPGLGRVRHVYVLAAMRGRGIGRSLVAALLDHACGRFERLRLSTRSQAAARLYESFGFVRDEAAKQTHRLDLQISSAIRR